MIIFSKYTPHQPDLTEKLIFIYKISPEFNPREIITTFQILIDTKSEHFMSNFLQH